MKKSRLFLPLTALALLFSFGLASCGGGGSGEESQQQQSSGAEEKITITAEGGKNKLIKGESVQLTASVAGVTWASDKTDIATVSESGLVQAIGKGSAKITAKKAGYKDGSLTITVDLETITLSGATNNAELVMEQTVTLTANKEGVTWATSDANVATVANGVVTGVAPGSVTISAKKDGFNDGKITLNVVRPAATATLHWEDADHFAADGWWGTSDDGYTPVYARDSGNASDAKCIAHFGAGDKETLSFTSNAAIQAELVVMMASSNELADMSAVMSVKLNNTAITVPVKAFTTGSNSQFEEFSLGTQSIISGENALELTFLESDNYPYLDDLAIYSKQTATITLKAVPEKEQIQVKFEDEATNLTAYIGEETQIELVKPTSLQGVSFVSSKTDVATVSEDGKITGVALGTSNITIMKDGMLSVRVEVVVEKRVIQGEIRVEAEDTTNDLPSGFHKYTDRTQGITAGHSGSAYITGYDVNSECELDYEFTSPKDQVMTLIIAGASHYQMSEDFVFGVDCKLLLNGAEITCAADAKIVSDQRMGAPTVEVTIGDVNVVSGTNTFVVQFTTRAPALDCFRFMPKAA